MTEPTAAPSIRAPGAGTRVPVFDGVRGIAILSVILFHTAHLGSRSGIDRVLERVTGAGWLGVDLFFVLSGFLITGILLDTKGAPGFFRNFYARRTLRIFPLFYAVVLVVAFVIPLVVRLSPDAPESAMRYADDLWHNQLWLWTYTHNYLQATRPHTLPGLGHLWSLAVEEQFYLLWPMVVFRVPTRLLLRTAAGVCIAACLLRIVLAGLGIDPWAIRQWTFTRVDTLLLGGIAAMVVRAPERLASIGRVLPAVMSACAAVLVASSLITGPLLLDSAYSASVVYPLAALGFAAWMVRLCDPSRRSRFLGRAWLRRVGFYSYAMYMFHWPLAQAFSAAFVRMGVSGALTSIGTRAPLVALEFGSVTATSFAAAVVSWRLWERHWLALKDRFGYTTRRAIAAD